MLAALACSSAGGPGPHATAAPTAGPASSPVSPTAAASPTPPPVPEEYRAVYDSLDQALARLEKQLDAGRAATEVGTTFAAELTPANGNRVEDLLGPAAMRGVRLYLDRLQELGVQGVAVSISYPLLSPEFPRSQEYLQFYRDVAGEVRAREMRLLVKSGPLFPDPQFSNLAFDYASLARQEYLQGRQAQLRLIAGEIRPDYLTIGAEFDTEQMVTGLAFSFEEYLAFVRETARGIDRSAGVLVGAGTGNWEDPAYLKAYAEEPDLDYVDFHIYPLEGGADYMRRALDSAANARDRGKKLVISEAWLYKATPAEVMEGAHYADIIGRDPYGFWGPLDRRFIAAVGTMAREQSVEFVSFFWSQYFFAYLDYEPGVASLSNLGRTAEANRAAVGNLQAGRFTQTGVLYRELIQGGPAP